MYIFLQDFRHVPQDAMACLQYTIAYTFFFWNNSYYSLVSGNSFIQNASSHQERKKSRLTQSGAVDWTQNHVELDKDPEERTLLDN